MSSRRRETTMDKHSETRLSVEVWEEDGICSLARSTELSTESWFFSISILIACPLSNLAAFVRIPSSYLALALLE